MGDAEQAPVRERLELHGAEFIYSKLGDVYGYTRSWVKEARRLDPDGVAGELALLLLMERGFETRLCQDQGGLGFRAVIEQGEAFLRAKPHAPIGHSSLIRMQRVTVARTSRCHTTTTA